MTNHDMTTAVLMVLGFVLFMFSLTWGCCCCCDYDEDYSPIDGKPAREKGSDAEAVSTGFGADRADASFPSSSFGALRAAPTQDKLSHDSGIILDSFHRCPRSSDSEMSSENALFQGRFDAATDDGGDTDIPVPLDERAESTRVD